MKKNSKKTKSDKSTKEVSIDRCNTENTLCNKDRFRNSLLLELGQFSMICGLAIAGASLTGCDDDAWYDEVRLLDCNSDKRIDTRDKECQNQKTQDSSSSSGGGSWDNHYNVIEYPNWANTDYWL